MMESYSAIFAPVSDVRANAILGWFAVFALGRTIRPARVWRAEHDWRREGVTRMTQFTINRQ